MTQRDPSYFPRPKFQGMTQISPGFYDDGHGSLHVDAEEVCVVAGVPYTDENVRALLEACFESDVDCVQVTR